MEKHWQWQSLKSNEADSGTAEKLLATLSVKKKFGAETRQPK